MKRRRLLEKRRFKEKDLLIQDMKTFFSTELFNLQFSLSNKIQADNIDLTRRFASNFANSIY